MANDSRSVVGDSEIRTAQGGHRTNSSFAVRSVTGMLKRSRQR